ncbi:MAG: Ig-like domain-containing protein, partial [Pseudomonadota bacterium]|nr:Ig-like domain-containing protein [Pseudomonadota bacterium]
IDVNSEFAHIEFQNGDVLTLTEALALAAGNTATYDTGGGRDTVDSVGVVGGTVMIDLKGGNDIYYGRFADISDIIYGGDGREYIQSGFGDDTIFGGRGDDYHLNGEEGNDYIDGGEGRDTYIIGSSTGIGGHVDLTAGIAYNDGYGGVDTLVSIEGVTGTDFDDLVVGDASDNHFSSDEGADTFYGMDGSDTVILSSRYVGENRYIDGGDGSDWVRYDDSSYNQSLVIDLGAGTVSGKGKAGQDTLVSIENVVGSLAGGDHITGSDADNTVYLDSFYDLGGTVLGMGGNDTLYGSAYEDTLEGGDGVDVLIGRDGNDTLIGGAGNDTLEGGAGDDTYIFAAGDGIDVIRDTEGENIFIIEGGINIEDLVTTRKGNDLILHIASGVTFENYFESEPADNAFVVQTTTGQQVDAKMLEINNEAPTAQNDEFETLQDLIVTGNVFSDNGYGADSDPDGDILHATPLSLSTDFGGTFTLLEDGSFTYTPEQGFSGIDTVTYSITDGYEGTDSAEITFIVTDPNLPPEAQDDVVNAQEDTEIIIDVLANDTDANGDDLTVSIESAPTTGTVVVNADQTVTYTANENYNGADSFTYT